MSFLSHVMHLLMLAILVCFQSIFPFADSVTPSIQTDVEALISFKSQISFESSDTLSSWNQNSSPCNWTGVVCNKFGNRVAGLNLSNMGLVGSISPYIGNLSLLQSLQLQNNQLTGRIPGQICNLFRLKALNMSFNRLEGPLPSNISKFVKLKVLDLMMNRITGRVIAELSSLSKLQVLNLGRNLLSGAIPPSIANISALVNLNLGTNALTGMIPSELSHLQNLKSLDLTINSLTGTVPSSIYNMSSLVFFGLASNQLWGKIPSNIGSMLLNLRALNFCINKFTGTIPGSLHNLTEIQQIRMAHNLLEGTVPPGLGNLPFLEMYNIGFNKIISSGDNGLEFITLLTNSTRLQFLAFDGNLLRGVIPNSIGNLSKVLSKLYMGGNDIYGSIPASIGYLSSLTLLNLSYNAITGSIPPEIGKLENLQTLSLAGNHISGDIPGSIGSLSKLNNIALSGNQLAGRIPDTFGNFPVLLSMDLSNNRLNGSIPKEVFRLPSLTTIMNLSNNFFGGNLYQEIGLLENVVTIDLSNSQLSGDIPNTIRNCKSLENLYLYKNKFSGSIPGTLGEVKGLEILDLSHNDLSGFIPADLQTLKALQSLNLAFNDLEGIVPSDGVFTNLSRVHLEGNPKLCLSLACGSTQGSARRLVAVYVVISVIATLALIISVGSFFYVRKSRRMKMAAIHGQHPIVSLLSYDELRQATMNFNEANSIGSGGFGSVYKGHLRDGNIVAVKVVDIQKTGSWRSFVAECEALRNVRHRNVIKLITYCWSLDGKREEFLALVYEFLGNGSLEDWLKGKKKKTTGDGLNLKERLNVAIDIATALDYLHFDCIVPVVHCDLKPTNILLDSDMTAKVGDFGLARLLMEQLSDQTSISSSPFLKGSIGYMPPEYGLGAEPSTAGDVYSFGVTLLELFTSKSPTDDSFVEGKNLITWVQLAFPAEVQQVLDPELLLHCTNKFELDDQHVSPETCDDCLISILGTGLSCTVDSPVGRISIRDALYRLKAARDNLLANTPTAMH